MDMIALDRLQSIEVFARQHLTPSLGREDQMGVHHEDDVSARPYLYGPIWRS
jgi:hypothetical protein